MKKSHIIFKMFIYFLVYKLIIGLNYAQIPLKYNLIKPSGLHKHNDSGPPWVGSLNLPLRLQQLGQRCRQV